MSWMSCHIINGTFLQRHGLTVLKNSSIVIGNLRKICVTRAVTNDTVIKSVMTTEFISTFLFQFNSTN